MSTDAAESELRAGRPTAAAALLEARLAAAPEDARGWFLLGACRHALNDLLGAAEAFARSYGLESRSEALLAQLTVLRQMGNAPAALPLARQGLHTFAGEPRMEYAAALALEDAGLTEEALSCYERALLAAPDFADALHNRGLLLARNGRLADAEINFRRCIEAHPDSERARSALADVLLAAGNYHGAIDELDALLRLAHDDASAFVRRGVALACLQRFSEAREALHAVQGRYPQAISQMVERLAPGSQPGTVLSPENIFLVRQYMALGQCDWSAWPGYVAQMRKAASEPGIALEPAVAFMAQHLPLDGVERHAIARGIASAIESRAPVMAPPPARRLRRLRIGILSPDFREHLNAYLLLPLFQLIDRARFEIFAYSLAADDGSAARARVRAAADCFRDVHGMADSDAAQSIRSDDIDILVDAAGHTAGGRFPIIAQRPARLQVLYLGFSCSLGSRRVDYAIVDGTVGTHAAEWSEALVYLPDTYYLYDFRRPVPQGALSRRDYGLPDDAFVYCAFHKPEKIAPDVFELWLEVLQRVPQSVLWFLALPPAAVRNLRAAAARRGIEPARLMFAPFEPRDGPRYLPRQRLGDLMLDSLHHNAMTTACDALGVGLPVLTLRGSAIASRAGESLLRAAGLEELVAADRDAFVRLAVRLARQPSVLADYRDRLQSNRWTAPLFDTAGRVRALEQAFYGMLARAASGEPPRSFAVELGQPSEE